MICRACHQTKPETEFTKCGDGRRSICRECDSAARRQRDFGISGEEFELLNGRTTGFAGAVESDRRLFSITSTGKRISIRGALCQNCNRGLGLLGDDIEGVRRALDYLHRYEARKASNRR